MEAFSQGEALKIVNLALKMPELCNTFWSTTYSYGYLSMNLSYLALYYSTSVGHNFFLFGYLSFGLNTFVSFSARIVLSVRFAMHSNYPLD